MTKKERIIKKVKGLLAIAKDKKNDGESISALLMAQRLMLEYSIDTMDVAEYAEQLNSKDVKIIKVTPYKRFYWFEKSLMSIICENFKVKHYYHSFDGKMSLKVVGHEEDASLAIEMYKLSLELVKGHAGEYVNKVFEEVKEQHPNIKRSMLKTSEIKNSYISGFLSGTKEKFKEQKDLLEKNYGLMVMTPNAVVERYDEIMKEGEPLYYKMPAGHNNKAYGQGVEKGRSVDYTKGSIG